MNADEEADTPGAERERARRRVCALFDDAVAEGGVRGTRDAALIAVLLGAGVPPARAVALPLDAWDSGTGTLRWRSAPEGGGDAPGEVEARRAIEGARAALEAWIGRRGDASGPLLCRVDAEGVAGREPLAPADVDRILAARARSAGVRAGRTDALRRLYDSPWWEDAVPPDPAGGTDRRRREREPAVDGDP